MGPSGWGIQVDPRVLDYLKRLQPKESRQLAIRMLEMSRDPFPPDSRPLRDVEGGRRVDVAGFRLLYHVDPDARRVVFFVAGRRNDGEVYREVERLRKRIRGYVVGSTGTRRP